MKEQKKVNNRFDNALSKLADMALAVTTMNVNSTCWFYTHQDEIPAKARKLRKFQQMKLVDGLIHDMLDKHIIQEQDRELYQYGLENGISLLLNILTLLLIGSITGKLDVVFVFSISFITLRSYAGGFHLERKAACYLLSTILVFVPLYSYDICIKSTSVFIRIIMLALSIFLITMFSPMNSTKRRLDVMEIRQFKKMTMIILGIQFIALHAMLVLEWYVYAFTIFVSFILIAILQLLGKADLYLKHN